MRTADCPRKIRHPPPASCFCAGRAPPADAGVRAGPTRSMSDAAATDVRSPKRRGEESTDGLQWSAAHCINDEMHRNVTKVPCLCFPRSRPNRTQRAVRAPSVTRIEAVARGVARTQLSRHLVLGDRRYRLSNGGARGLTCGQAHGCFIAGGSVQPEEDEYGAVTRRAGIHKVMSKRIAHTLRDAKLSCSPGEPSEQVGLDRRFIDDNRGRTYHIAGAQADKKGDMAG